MFINSPKQADKHLWSEYKDSNLGPSAPKADALPGCATLRMLVPSDGIEPSRRKAADFESAVSTYSTTKAYLSIIYNCNVDV